MFRGSRVTEIWERKQGGVFVIILTESARWVAGPFLAGECDFHELEDMFGPLEQKLESWSPMPESEWEDWTE